MESSSRFIKNSLVINEINEKLVMIYISVLATLADCSFTLNSIPDEEGLVSSQTPLR
jgi:hypothetical protein